ncbi:MAG: T9SS type A sorting domain-containing protein [Bacteroidetes bacterium]|nr:MAG: T9SS type A sorting domain-containing protein [Bacteroidota bacterium]
MKKLYIAITAAAVFSFGKIQAQDLIPGNVTADYDFTTAVLSNISFELKNIGSITTFDAVTCELYLVDIGSKEYLLGSADSDEFGLAAGATENLSIADIDLDNISGLTTGSYYLRLDVDVSDVEEEDNETNNSKTYTDSKIDFESLAGLKEQLAVNRSLKVFPNPVMGNQFQIQLNNTTDQTTFVLSDVQGKVLHGIPFYQQNQTLVIEVSEIPAGIYFYELIQGNTRYQGKIAKY